MWKIYKIIFTSNIVYVLLLISFALAIFYLLKFLYSCINVGLVVQEFKPDIHINCVIECKASFSYVAVYWNLWSFQKLSVLWIFKEKLIENYHELHRRTILRIKRSTQIVRCHIQHKYSHFFFVRLCLPTSCYFKKGASRTLFWDFSKKLR